MFLPSSARKRGKSQRSQNRRPFLSPLASSSSQDFYYQDDEEEFGGGGDERRRDPDEIAFLSSRDIGSVEGVDATIAASVKDTLQRVTEDTILGQYS